MLRDIYMCFLFTFFFSPIIALQYNIANTKLNTEVLRAYSKHQLNEDIYLSDYLNQFPFYNYEIYPVEDDLYFVEKDTKDAIKNNVIKKGALWEKHIYDLLKQYTLPNSIAVDIGAHIGTHTIALSRFVGENGAVFAFEPQLKLYSEMTISTHLSGCLNVIPYRRALGSKTSWIEMEPTNLGNEGNTLVGSGGDKVKMERLDTFKLNNVSVMKIDVEGYEMEVIEGAKETILSNKPVMLIEIWRNGDHVQRIADIEKLGYTSVHILNDDFLFLPIQNIESQGNSSFLQ